MANAIGKGMVLLAVPVGLMLGSFLSQSLGLGRVHAQAPQAKQAEAQKAEGKPVQVVISIDGIERDRFELEPHRFWMERRAIMMPAGDAAARVSFTITCEENGWRETVIEADVLSSLPEPLRNWATAVSE